MTASGHFLITGCSGAGKSSLIEELAARGYAVVREPGRRLIAQGIAPWEDMRAFLLAAEQLARADLEVEGSPGRPVFFDRGLLDAVAGLERVTGEAMERRLGAERPYARGVFFACAWPAIYAYDAGRRHSLEQAQGEERHLRLRLPELGYRLHEVPQASLAARADFILRTIAERDARA